MDEEVSFSKQLRHSGGQVKFSPNSKFVATALEKKVTVREPHTLEVVSHFSCVDGVNLIEWAPNSDFILCASFQKGVVQVFSVSDPEWHSTIREGVAGLTKCSWTPDSLHVVTFSDFNLHMTIWSLVSKDMFIIRQPKSIIEFSPDNMFMAVPCRRKCKDWLCIYRLQNDAWVCEVEFELQTLDLMSIQFGPDGNTIVVYDSELHYMIQVYSLDGTLLMKYQAYDDALGVKATSTCTSPCGNFVAVGSHDQCLRLLSPLTWRPILEYHHKQHPKHLPACYKCNEITYYCEVDEAANDTDDKENSSFSINNMNMSTNDSVMGHSLSSKPNLPSVLPYAPPDAKRPTRGGVGLASWSSGGRYLATRNDSCPTILWIWDVQGAGLRSVVAFLEPVRAVRWRPVGDGAEEEWAQLAVATGNQRLYLWAPGTLRWLDCPEGFEASGLRWAAAAAEGQPSLLAVLTPGRAAICYME
ncbi:unnamed protein product, partial [Heterosigma akashiwo]